MGLIYLDSCLLIYAVEQHPVWAATVRAAMAAEPQGRFAISPLVTMECLVKPLKDGHLALQQRYQTALGLLMPLALGEQVFLQAAQLRAHFGLKTPDALHLACAQHHGCSALWTNDDRLAQAAHGLAKNVLR
ncbi:MAG TPA: PIN domain-containing protein [Ideonella sp.]|nr:PIN domain-containing protein [Ideonella sp.]